MAGALGGDAATSGERDAGIKANEPRMESVCWPGSSLFMAGGWEERLMAAVAPPTLTY